MRRWLWAGAVWLCAFGVRADAAVMMQPFVEEGIAEDVRASVLRAVAKSLAADGISVIPLEKSEKYHVLCGEAACLKRTLDAFAASVGVHVTILAAAGGGEASIGSVGIELFAGELAYASKAVRVLDRGIERAVDEAVRTARALQKRGPGPWLVIDGTPRDAAVSVDGVRIDDGELPVERKVSAGQHVVTAARPGYVGEEYHVFVGSAPAAQWDVSVQLASSRAAIPERIIDAPAPANAGPAPVQPAALPPHAADYALGAALAVGGVLLATVSPLRTAAQEGDCYDAACRQTVQLQPGATAGYIVGGLATVGLGALVAFWIKPFARVLDQPGQSATVGVQGAF